MWITIISDINHSIYHLTYHLILSFCLSFCLSFWPQIWLVDENDWRQWRRASFSTNQNQRNLLEMVSFMLHVLPMHVHRIIVFIEHSWHLDVHPSLWFYVIFMTIIIMLESFRNYRAFCLDWASFNDCIWAVWTGWIRSRDLGSLMSS